MVVKKYAYFKILHLIYIFGLVFWLFASVFVCTGSWNCIVKSLSRNKQNRNIIGTYFGENVFFHDSPYLCLPEVCFHYQEYNFPETAKTGFTPKIWTCIFTIHLNWFLRTCLWRNNHNRENYYNAVRLEYIAGSVPESSVPTNMFDWMLLSVIQTSFSGSNTPVPVFVSSWQMFSVFWLTYRCSNSSKLFPATFPCSTRSTKLRATMKMLFLLHTTKVSAKKLSIFTTASADRCLQPYPAMTT